MPNLPTLRPRLVFVALAAVAAIGSAAPVQAQSQSRTYPQLEALFTEWRTFEEPPRVTGIPDYRPATNTRRLAQLKRMQARLAAIDTTGWPVPDQVDWHLVRAEMNGMLYNLTVLTPWSRDPAYYASIKAEQSDTPAEEGPTIHGAIRLWKYPVWPRTRQQTSQPLSAEQSKDLATQLNAIPVLLRQAKINLARGNAKDLWVGAVKTFEEQHELLAELKKLSVAANGDAALLSAIDAASSATGDFTTWLRTEAPKKTGPSGIGKANYTWFLKNVLLVPLTWDEEVTITRRELARSHASLRLEEQRNKDLPPMPVMESREAYLDYQNAAITRYITYVRDKKIASWEPWMDNALRERIHPFTTPDARNFFAQTYHRDPIPLWTHLWHWWDNGRIQQHPHPRVVRRGPLLYNVWMSRAEGMATSMEEWMMQMGLYDVSPRSREIVWTMLAARAARGLGNLYAHSNELTMAQAADMHVSWTPRGWMRRDPLLGFEQHLYLRQPGYGASYVTGGRLMEETMAMRARQLGDQFTMQRFFDEVNAAGMIPVSMVYWELTGDDRMLRELRNDATPRPFTIATP